MSLIVLLVLSLAKSCFCILDGIPELPELPGSELKAEVEAPEKLFDGPLSPFKRLFVVSLHNILLVWTDVRVRLAHSARLQAAQVE